MACLAFYLEQWFPVRSIFVDYGQLAADREPKAAIWDFCKSRMAPLELTCSCECAIDQPCRQCQSCLDLEVPHARS
jgi:hypothetical protein